MKLLLSIFLFASVTQGADKYLAFTTDYPPFYDTVGFDWLSRLEVFRLFDGQAKTHAFSHGGYSYTVRWGAQPPVVGVLEAGQVLAQIDLSQLLKKAGEYQAEHLGSPIPHGMLVEEVKTAQGRLRVYLEAISAEETSGVLDVHHLKCDVLFSRPAAKVR